MKEHKCGCLTDGAIQMCKVHAAALNLLAALTEVYHVCGDDSYPGKVARAAIAKAKGPNS